MRRIWNKRMVGQREENGKGARSLPLLMQIIATLKESRKDKHWCECMHALREPWNTERGFWKKKNREGRNKMEWQQVKTTKFFRYIRLVDPVARPLFRNVPLSQNCAPPLCLTDITKRRQKRKIGWHEAELASMGRPSENRIWTEQDNGTDQSVQKSF